MLVLKAVVGCQKKSSQDVQIYVDTPLKDILNKRRDLVKRVCLLVQMLVKDPNKNPSEFVVKKDVQPALSTPFMVSLLQPVSQITCLCITVLRACKTNTYLLHPSLSPYQACAEQSSKMACILNTCRDKY